MTVFAEGTETETKYTTCELCNCNERQMEGGTEGICLPRALEHRERGREWESEGGGRGEGGRERGSEGIPLLTELEHKRKVQEQ